MTSPQSALASHLAPSPPTEVSEPPRRGPEALGASSQPSTSRSTGLELSTTSKLAVEWSEGPPPVPETPPVPRQRQDKSSSSEGDAACGASSPQDDVPNWLTPTPPLGVSVLLKVPSVQALQAPQVVSPSASASLPANGGDAEVAHDTPLRGLVLGKGLVGSCLLPLEAAAPASSIVGATSEATQGLPADEGEASNLCDGLSR